ncbi:MAG: thioredoxin domain-containing protein [archaeon]
MTKTQVLWLPWNNESLKKAEQEDKPILLDISAVWCHWCHVMDEKTYSDNIVARLINEKFVPIRVDRDQRPDIDKRYNMGGWPSTVFLTPKGEILTGGTYIPATQMAAMLDYVSDLYQNNRESIQKSLNELKKKQTKQPQITQETDTQELQSVTDNLILEIATMFDSAHGGFGQAPKFPHTEALRLALLEHALGGQGAMLTIVKKTLTAMAEGGIYDKEEDGFFRYSTTRDWSIPHYEKMCEDNAKLLVNYIEAFQVTGEQKFKETAQGIIAYVNNKLSDQQKGGFFGSQDADEIYYKLKLTERQTQTPPTIDKTLFVNWNSMMASAYLLGAVVFDDQSLRKFALKTVNLLLDKAFSLEKGMSHYIIDEKSSNIGFLTDNAYMLQCLIDCYQVTSEKKYLDYAQKLAQFMFNKLWDSTGGFLDKPEDTNAFGALKKSDKPLEENSITAQAFLKLYHITGNSTYLEKAKKTLEYFVSSAKRYGIMASSYGIAAELYLRPVQVHIIGNSKDSATLDLKDQGLKTYNAVKTVETIDPILDEQRLKALGYPAPKEPTAYVCSEGKCTSTTKANEVAEKIRA